MLNEAIIDTMVRQAMDIMRNAYVRHESSLAVGACVLASDGTLYSGCNLENRMPQLCVTAEQVARVSVFQFRIKFIFVRRLMISV